MKKGAANHAAPFSDVYNMNQQTAQTLAIGMAEMASIYPNHEIANALSSVSQKLESYGAPFAPKLTTLDKQIIAFYVNRTDA